MNPKSTKLYYALTQNNPETNNNNKCSVNTTHSKSKYNNINTNSSKTIDRDYTI